MSRLLALADEVLLQISEEFVQDDLQNLTLSCKRVHKVGKDTIQKHRERKAKYTKVICGRVGKGETGTVLHPILLLRDALMHRRIALYTQHLCLNPIPLTFAETHKAEVNRALKELNAMIEAKVQANP